MARLLNYVLGHEQIIERFLQAAKDNKLANTFLFVGPSGVGKRTTALALTQALMCPVREDGCGECGSCLRIAKGQHEGLMLIAPEGQQIKIEQSRALLDFLSLRSLSKVRVVIIDAVESMNSQSANALLKIFEEPPENTYFFLIAPSSRHVLATIRSRSQIIRFSPIPLEKMRMKSPAADWVLRASQGSFEKLSYLSEKDELANREKAVQLIEMWLAQANGTLSSGYLLPEFREMIRGRDAALSLAQHLLLLLRDAAFWSAGERQHILNPDKKNIYEQLSQLSPNKLTLMTSRALGLEGALRANRDSQLVFEEFWIQTQNI